MKKIKQTYAFHFRNKSFIVSLLSSIVVLGISLVANYYAGAYAIEKASNSVTDLILDNFKVRDVDGIFIYGPLLMLTFLGIILLARPHRIPYVLKSIGLFVLVRSIFVSLTHIATFPNHALLPPNSGFLGTFFTSGADLFFSGHTGLPFLLALIFWDEIYLRAIFIVFSVVLGVIVLLGHFHYSIDVLSAFFITYSINRLAQILFKKDLVLFLYDTR